MALDRKIALVNLSSQKMESKMVPRAMRESYIGGRGLNTYLLFNHMPSVVDPLAPESVLVLGAGLLCGTPAPAAAATHFAFRSPLSGFLGSGSLMGHFGAELKLAGFDHLVISGKAPRLSLLHIEDESIGVIPVPELAGLDTVETVRRCRERVEDEDAQVLCIGPAGEKGILLADVRPAFGEGFGTAGLGAVFGAKNLKAIVVRGTLGLRLAAPDEAMKAFRALSGKILATKTGRSLATWGTSTFFDAANAAARVRVNHFGGNRFSESEAIEADALAKASPARSSCFACPIGCRRLYRPPASPGALEEGPGHQSLFAFGPLVGCRSPEALLDADRQCRRAGLDPWETGTALAWTMEALEKGLLKPSQIDWTPPAISDPGLLKPWIE
ncbi:MAG: aldehyde ferredoxin oxidoreductase N-terminal domain-containing protein, partial [Planctomycetota bacterium]